MQGRRIEGGRSSDCKYDRMPGVCTDASSSPAQLKAMANVEDHIVPVRLEVEHDHWKLKDTFLWNCAGRASRPSTYRVDGFKDTVVTPEMFAQTMCDDFNVPVHQFGPKIVAAIIERVRVYQDQVLPILQRNADACRGKLDSDGEAMAVFRRARDGSEEIKTESGHEDDSHVKIVGIDVDDDEAVPMEERPMTVEEATNYLPPEQEEDLRILIKVGRPWRVRSAIDGHSGRHYRCDAESVGYLRVGSQLGCLAGGICAVLHQGAWPKRGVCVSTEYRYMSGSYN